METTLIVVAAVIVIVGLVGYLVTRRKGAETVGTRLPSPPVPTAAPLLEEKREASAPTPSEPRRPSAPPAPAQAPAARAGSPEEVGILKQGLANTRVGFISRLAQLFGRGGSIDASLLEQIEEVMLSADVGAGTTQKFITGLRDHMNRNELGDADKVWASLRSQAADILRSDGPSLNAGRRPTVVLVVGVNGVGKTTSIGKLASRLHQSGKKVLLAAGDTFRAAAVLQLEQWGRRVGCPVVKGKERADPGSVIFDAVRMAIDQGYDTVIADTAGRLHTKAPLMDELKKVARTVEKALGRPADEAFLVLDATNGQNAVQQAEMFKEALPVSGIILTKLDGTAKGGVILGIVDRHRVPVRYVGVGERVEDLREFDPESFAEALFARPEA